jgi:hypothetical protein
MQANMVYMQATTGILYVCVIAMQYGADIYSAHSRLFHRVWHAVHWQCVAGLAVVVQASHASIHPALPRASVLVTLQR